MTQFPVMCSAAIKMAKVKSHVSPSQLVVLILIVSVQIVVIIYNAASCFLSLHQRVKQFQYNNNNELLCCCYYCCCCVLIFHREANIYICRTHRCILLLPSSSLYYLHYYKHTKPSNIHCEPTTSKQASKQADRAKKKQKPSQAAGLAGLA